MLVLSRKIGEQIIINEDIVVTVVSVKGNQVRLGFTAPPEVAICREELLTDPEHVIRHKATIDARMEKSSST